MGVSETCWLPDCEKRADQRLRSVLPPLCSSHGLEVARAYRVEILAEEAKRVAEATERAKDREQGRQGNEGGRPFVYYARIGNYIKIGFSAHLQDRLRSLRVDELLAIEPGGREVERQRHVEFADLRIDLVRENFRGGDDLLRHILAMRDQYGLPRWATKPRTTEIRRKAAS